MCKLELGGFRAEAGGLGPLYQGPGARVKRLYWRCRSQRWEWKSRYSPDPCVTHTPSPPPHLPSAESVAPVAWREQTLGKDEHFLSSPWHLQSIFHRALAACFRNQPTKLPRAQKKLETPSQDRRCFSKRGTCLVPTGTWLLTGLLDLLLKEAVSYQQ